MSTCSFSELDTSSGPCYFQADDFINSRMSTCNLSELQTCSLPCFFQMIEINSQNSLSSPMPWIGLYVAAASLVCLLALAADTFQGFRQKTFWIPCKFLTLNAATLTLLAVAMKLPLDLGTSISSMTDQMAKVSSMAFMCIIMANFMPSLGAMSDKEILMNLVALIILVITVLVNIGLQLYTGAIFSILGYLVIVPLMFFMLMLVVILVATALALSTFRNILEQKYGEIHKVASSEELEKNGMITVGKLKECIRKYWIMAKTGNPQFHITRFPTYYASSAICFLVATGCFSVVGWTIYTEQDMYMFTQFSSDYKWSTLLILVIQSTGVIVGTIAPVSRWLTATVSNCSGNTRNIGRFKVENYWIQKLLYWKWSLVQIQNQSLRKLVQTMKILVLDLCIVFQKVTVVASKAVRYTSIVLVSLIISPFQKVLFQTSASRHNRKSEEDDVRRYVLHLEGEEELSEKSLKDISRSLNDVIGIAKRQRPRSLANLLKKCTSIEGMAEFNCNESPNSWSLVVVTLTSIAIVLPNIGSDVDTLLCSVGEGLIYVRQIEESLDGEGLMVDTRRSVDYIWLMVELYRKWLDEDLQELALNGKRSKENLEFLAGVAFKSIPNSERGANDRELRAIAANSMHRICQIMLLDFLGDVGMTDEILFQKISVTIANTIASCLTNFPRLIIRKCYSSSIENREECISTAARLLGETEEILDILQQLDCSNINIDQGEGNDSSVRNVNSTSGSSAELHLDIAQVS